MTSCVGVRSRLSKSPVTYNVHSISYGVTICRASGVLSFGIWFLVSIQLESQTVPIHSKLLCVGFKDV